MRRIALVGKPNSGKSSLFNLLTGLNQKIGNYSGVTVEKKSGQYKGQELMDLPGIKSLRAATQEEIISRNILLDYVKTESPVIFVANGVQLEDNLIFFSEIADLQIPAILVINFKDDLEKRNIHIDLEGLQSRLGCPVVLLNSRSGDGLDVLAQNIEQEKFRIPNAFRRSQYDVVADSEVKNNFIESFVLDEALDLDNATEDYNYRENQIRALLKDNSEQNIDSENFLKFSKKLDKVLLHPIFGVLIFLSVMLVVFQSVFFIATIPMDWIDMLFAYFSEAAGSSLPDSWFRDLITDGILPGIGGVVIFIPQIAILFLLLGILEHTGYLTRISFIANRFLSNFGLSGQSVVPLMSSWACAIPAIMSTRIINDPKERFALIFSSPLMTCSARLPVYTILISIMYPNDDGRLFNAQGLLLLALYLMGVIATLLVAKLVYKRAGEEGLSLFSLELPIYRIPNWRNVFYNMYIKTKSFVVEAGKIIFIVSILLWLL
ncbi:MAG: ferrous iron transport protein B, partial [Saprospiraceae bacterium]|nr:ferrous iron transport protein B [Saprospiraceae bacterium]